MAGNVIGAALNANPWTALLGTGISAVSSLFGGKTEEERRMEEETRRALDRMGNENNNLRFQRDNQEAYRRVGADEIQNAMAGVSTNASNIAAGSLGGLSGGDIGSSSIATTKTSPQIMAALAPYSQALSQGWQTRNQNEIGLTQQITGNEAQRAKLEDELTQYREKQSGFDIAKILEQGLNMGAGLEGLFGDTEKKLTTGEGGLPSPSLEGLPSSELTNNIQMPNLNADPFNSMNPSNPTNYFFPSPENYETIDVMSGGIDERMRNPYSNPVNSGGILEPSPGAGGVVQSNVDYERFFQEEKNRRNKTLPGFLANNGRGIWNFIGGR